MKGLDTPILLGILRGEPRVMSMLRKWEGEELSTTSVNLFELEALARSNHAPGKERRLAAIERLRRKLTVLPVDERAARLSAQAVSRAGAGESTSVNWLILGALLGAGCGEWVTAREASFPSSSELKVTIVASSASKA